MKLVWLFQEHRDTVEAYRAMEHRLWRVEAEVARLREDNAELAEALKKAQEFIQSNPSYINNVMDLMQKYQEQVLQELPLQPDQQPEWLTPGEDDN